ncbi:MAG: prolipoprotein diacylglyceryl transferase family protein [Flavobacteriales bacterium]
MRQVLHLLFEVAAFVVGYWYFQVLRNRKGDPIQEGKRTWIIVGAAAGALIGSRVLGALEDPTALAWNWRAVFIAFNNRTIVGGLLGGLIGVEVTKKLIGEPQRSGDLFTHALILAMMIGRVGCFLGGLEDNTYGRPTELPWGIDLGDGVNRHPTNLYEILWLGLIWLLLTVIETRWVLAPGARFRIFMVLYLEFRFFEFLKPAHPVLWGFTTIQIAAELGVLYYFKVYLEPRSLIQRADG